MSDLVQFKPRSELGAEDNLQAFIAFCRNEITIFGSDLNFEANVWDVTKTIHLKGKKHAIRVVFSSWATKKSRCPDAMPEPFLSFAKAYFRYQHGFRPVSKIDNRLSALRTFCAALTERGTANPTLADAGVLNRASQLLSGHFNPSSAYQAGCQLELLATFLDDSRLCAVPLHWKNPLPRPIVTSGRVGLEFDEVRKSKLPSAYVLDSLARAFRLATEPVDVVVTSIAAILCSSPDRINEVLRLRAECEVKQERKDSPPAYGLRFWPSKGAEPMVKWVVPSMATVVEEALARIRKHTDYAREVARWYELNPTAMFLPPHLEHLRGCDELTMAEVKEILFFDSKESGLDWCKRNKVDTRKIGRKQFASFADLERVVLGMLPKGFPIFDVSTGLKYSEALCITPRNFFHATRGELRCLIEPIGQGAIYSGLGNRANHGDKSVFDRLQLFEPDGAPIHIRSHQFRHYLNTLAQTGGMSELDIAKWSGRTDIRQNGVYNHVSDRDMQAKIAEIKGENSETFGQLVAQTRVSLLPRARFAELNIQTAHTTDLGFCVHDFAMTPCQIHMDCINCNEQVCIKGDEYGEANARAMCRETKALLDEARAADADGAYGATQWVKHQELTHERLTQLIGILDDPSVPNGSIIRLTYIKPASRLQQAAEARKALPNLPPDVPQLAWRVVEPEPKV
jgi:hypothetical protein